MEEGVPTSEKWLVVHRVGGACAHSTNPRIAAVMALRFSLYRMRQAGEHSLLWPSLFVFSLLFFTHILSYTLRQEGRGDGWWAAIGRRQQWLGRFV